MSYDIYLRNPDGTPVKFDKAHHISGGTYAMGGTTQAVLNITYNYSPFYYEHLGKDGIRSLYGKSGHEIWPTIVRVISILGTRQADDYWAVTEGNAGKALLDLLTLMAMAPEAIVDGD